MCADGFLCGLESVHAVCVSISGQKRDADGCGIMTPRRMPLDCAILFRGFVEKQGEIY